MDEALKHQIIVYVEDTCINRIWNNWTGFLGINAVNMIHHLMNRYGKNAGTDLKENQKWFYEALETIIPIYIFIEIIDEFIQYSDDGKHP